jgi:arginyl-tRNA synthetase
VEKWNPPKILYVVSNEQALHFEQLFEAASLLGYIAKEKLAHVKFGLVLGEKGTKMSTRKGEIIRLEELITKATSLARGVVEKTNLELSDEEKDLVARIVGIGAIKWNDLAQHRVKDIVFDWEKMLSIKGFSAPYVQYTYARLKSILRKSEARNPKSEIKLVNFLREPEEQVILRHLLHYFEVVEDAANIYEPHRIAEYLYKLADLTNNFYEKLPVLKAEQELRDARLLLIGVVGNTLKQGMSFLGIDVPERM